MKVTLHSFHQTKNSRYESSNDKNNITKKLTQSFMTTRNYNTISHTQNQISNQMNEYLNLNNKVFRDQRINDLQLKNDRLKTQIKNIQKVLDQLSVEIKPEYGIKLPEIKQNVLGKQLDNAYKLIKHYEYEIQKVKYNQKQGSFANRISKAQKLLKQKTQLKIKLKIELQKVKKSSKDYTKALTDNRSKIQLQTKSKTLNSQLKMYQKRIQQQQKKKQFFNQTHKKKKQYILQLQKKLWESGITKKQIQDIRYQIFDSNKNKIAQNKQDQPIQDRSKQTYKSLLNQIKLLRKVTVTNQKLLNQVQSQKDQYLQKNRKLEIRINQTDKEIQLMQNQINFLKKHVDPLKLKPKIKSPELSATNGTFNNVTLSSGDTSFQILALKNNNILQHQFTAVQVGQINRRSQKYNDRKLLGKKIMKIVSVQLYQNRMQFLGVQFTYAYMQQRIQGNLMMVKNQNQRHLQKKIYNLESSDYVATVQCFLNSKNYIVGMILTSLTGKVMRCGSNYGSKRFLQINPDQYPICAYACIYKEGFQLIGFQKYQPPTQIMQK